MNKSLREKYLSVRKHSEAICQPLQPEDFVVQPVVDVSPPKWHLAHTTWFWEEFVLVPHLKGYKRFHERYSFLFNSYYNSLGQRVLRFHRGNMSRPTVKEIMDYRHFIDEHMMTFLENVPSNLTALVEIGLNHEQQHQELLYTDIKYIFGHNPLFPPYEENFKEARGSVKANREYISVSDGNYDIGFIGEGFSFDNEHGYHRVFVQAFEIGDTLVTNGEYLEFMNENGYGMPDHWHSDGWAWVIENKIDSPLYWHPIDGTWHRYSLAGLMPVDMNEPVTHVSYYEAFAFAQWKGMRLPTEFEWEIASEFFSWGERWEHTNSAYLPYPGFTKADGAVGEYNGKFMVNQMVLRGASVVTSEGHSRKTYRNFFSPQLQWQFNGIRLCKK